MSIWQKDTIREALPDEYKDKRKQEAAQMGNEAEYGSGQATEFDTDENRIGREILTLRNRAPLAQ